MPFITMLIGAFLFISMQTFGQVAKVDSSFLQRSVNYAILLHSKSVNKYAHLYNGAAYVDYDINITGHPFFESISSEEGLVHYDGVEYQNVPLLYDIKNDELLVDEYTFQRRIRLLSEKVRYFSLLQHNFVRIEQDSLANPAIKTGFYDQLYTGQVKVLAKRIKLIDEDISSGQLKADFVQKDKHYIWKDNNFYPVRTKGSVLKVLADRKKELQQYLRKNKIRFNENREAAMIKMASVYDQLQK